MIQSFLSKKMNTPEIYKTVFENLMVPVLLVDMSQVIKCFAEKKILCWADFNTHFPKDSAISEAFQGRIHFVDMNPAILRFFKFQNRIEFENNFFSCFTEETFDAFIVSVFEAFSGNLIFEKNSTIRTSKGQTRIVKLQRIITSSLEEDSAKWIYCFIDYTEQKFIEDSLKISENQCSIFLDESPIPIWHEDFSETKKYLDSLKLSGVIDLNHFFDEHPDELENCGKMIKLLGLNKAGQEFFGINQVDFLETNLNSFFNKGSMRVFKNLLISFSKGNLNFESEISFTGSNGVIKDSIIRLSVPKKHEKDYSLVIGSFMDITERKRSEEILSHYLKIEEITSFISTRFISISPENCEGEILHALEKLGRFYHADISSFTIFSKNHQALLEVYEWAVSPSVSLKQWALTIADFEECFPWCLEQIKLGRVISIRNLSDLKPEAKQEIDWMKANNFQSGLMVPIFYEEEFLASFNLFSKKMVGEVVFEDIGLLRIVGEDIVKLLVRKNAEMGLKESEERYRHIAGENARLLKQAWNDAQMKEILLQEINHRVKNNLSSIVGLLSIEQDFLEKGKKNFEFEILEKFRGRIDALSAVHNLLTKNHWSPLEISEVVRGVFSSSRLISGRKKVSFDISEMSLRISPTQATSLAFIANEIISNSIQHSLKDQKHIEIRFSFEFRDGKAVLTFIDNGGGFPENVLKNEPESLKAGLYLVKILTHNELSGEIFFSNEPGAQIRIVFLPKSVDEVIRVI
ncbi:MAG: sensor histidine kinase [Candidatus Riflebacteria bacterium]|nr:sensor histidine kinase [Candidatus Riflebacteria bacterium]